MVSLCSELVTVSTLRRLRHIRIDWLLHIIFSVAAIASVHEEKLIFRDRSSSVTDARARAWFLVAEFDVAEHTRLTNSDTDQLFPEYVREVFSAREKYLDARIK